MSRLRALQARLEDALMRAAVRAISALLLVIAESDRGRDR